MKLTHSFDEISSIDNLLLAWREFLPGKRNKPDVQEFGLRLMDNLLDLREELKAGTYRHSSYEAFKINDPKPRDIHKAIVRDRLLHHAIHRVLYPYFDKKFVTDSFSCRNKKGTHKALKRLKKMVYEVSKNDTRQCYILKCDIRKFFASIDHKILKSILRKHISDPRVLKLLGNVIGSFESTGSGLGLPLGNLTSQLLVNIYMSEFDQFVKHKLKEKYYIRYADDFVFLSHEKKHLEELVAPIGRFLNDKLGLQLHPNKVYIQALSSGLDFLGWVNFFSHRVLRTSTKRRMFKRLEEKPSNQVFQSYLGMLSHGDTYKVKRKLDIKHRT